MEGPTSTPNPESEPAKVSFVLGRNTTGANVKKPEIVYRMFGPNVPSFPKPCRTEDIQIVDALPSHLDEGTADRDSSPDDAFSHEETAEGRADEEDDEDIEEETAKILDYNGELIKKPNTPKDKARVSPKDSAVLDSASIAKRERTEGNPKHLVISPSKKRKQAGWPCTEHPYLEDPGRICVMHAQKKRLQEKRKTTFLETKAELDELLTKRPGLGFIHRLKIKELQGLLETLKPRVEEDERSSSPRPHKHVQCVCTCQASHEERREVIHFEDREPTDADLGKSCHSNVHLHESQAKDVSEASVRQTVPENIEEEQKEDIQDQTQA